VKVDPQLQLLLVIVCKMVVKGTLHAASANVPAGADASRAPT